MKILINDNKKVIQSLIKFQFVSIEPSEEVLGITIDLAYKFGITVYDASYLVLGVKYNTKMVTADSKLADKIPPEKIILIKEWNPK
jgi:predicted nucleic acid-binding protein